MKRILKYFKPYIPFMLILIVFAFAGVMCDLQLPDYMGRIINDGISKVTTGQSGSSAAMDTIWSTGGKMLLVAAGSMASNIIVGFLGSWVGTGLARDLRGKVFTTVEGYSLAEFDKFSTASLITRSTNDITQIQMATVMTLRMLITAPIMAVGSIIKALQNTADMAWIIALAIVILLGLIGVMFVVVMPKFRLQQKKIDQLNLVTRENLTGLRVIRAYGAEAHEEKRFDLANLDVKNINLFINRVFVFMMPFMMLLISGVSLLIIWVGAHQVANNGMPIGNMVAFMQYAIQTIFAFLMVSMVFIFLPRASVSGNRVADVLETKTTVLDPAQPREPDKSKAGLVEFENVTFGYRGAQEPVLSGISFTAEPGKTTAFIGSTGSGKSTVVNLIPRFYDVTGGSVKVDGVDVREMTQHTLRELIGYNPQQASVFSGTVSEVIGYGISDEQRAALRGEIEAEGIKDADAETLRRIAERTKRAADIAQASEFIDHLEDGYDATVSQGATNLSGGQKQRLSVARSIVKEPEIYIFDDTFSALDFRTDALLRAALHKATGGSTVLIVAQRISTIKHADKIVVLDEGRVVGEGTHDELMEKSEVYREIALSQLTKEELA